MNVARYSASITTQRKGTGATLYVAWFVTASRSADPHAGRAIHRARVPPASVARSSGTPRSAASPTRRHVLAVTATHETAKAPYATDQAPAWALAASSGSTRIG